MEKALMMRKTEVKKGSRWQRMGCLDSITDSMHMNLSKLQETVKDREVWHLIVHRVAKSGHSLVTGKPPRPSKAASSHTPNVIVRMLGPQHAVLFL